jgi:protein-disulfide isomerase
MNPTTTSKKRPFLICNWHRVLFAFAILLMTPIASSFESQAQVISSPPSPQRLKQLKVWQEHLSNLALPYEGCFTAKYPRRTWVPAPCGKPSAYTLTPAGGNEYSAQAQAEQLIATASGSFQNITGLGSESDTQFGTNAFSLQMNASAPFQTLFEGFQPTTGHSTNPCSLMNPCTGWEQFALQNDSEGATLEVEIWLIGFHLDYGFCPGPEPDGTIWNQGGGGNDCVLNSKPAIVFVQSIFDLGQFVLSGSAGQNGLDKATFVDIMHGLAYSASIPSNTLGLSQAWTGAQFNVLGFANGSEANFKEGTTITVVNALSGQSGAAISASCSTQEYTAETNNLNSSCGCFSSGGQITFTESNATSPVCVCPSGSTWSQSNLSCSCNVPGETINSTTGQCSCPPNSQLANNQCTCDVLGEVPIQGACACPAPGETVSQNQCMCPGGQTPQEINGSLQCACPGNELLVNGTCGCGQSGPEVVNMRNSCLCTNNTSPALNSFGTGYVCVSPPGGGGNACSAGAYLCNCGRNGWGPCPPRFGTHSSSIEQPKQVANPDVDRVKMSVGKDWYILGHDDAPVTVIEFADYQCPFCRRFETDGFAKLKKEYIDTGKVRFISRDMPLEFHSNATAAALAARCAGEQNKFWEMRDAMMRDSEAGLAADSIIKYGQNASLDMVAFGGCLQAKRYIPAIQKDVAEAGALGISGTPSFVIGNTARDEMSGTRIVGAVPYTVFETTINKLLSNK